MELYSGNPLNTKKVLGTKIVFFKCLGEKGKEAVLTIYLKHYCELFCITTFQITPTKLQSFHRWRKFSAWIKFRTCLHRFNLLRPLLAKLGLVRHSTRFRLDTLQVCAVNRNTQIRQNQKWINKQKRYHAFSSYFDQK